MYDASDPRKVAKAEKASRSADALSASFVRTSMSSLEGRAWFLKLLDDCYIFHTPFTGNANATAFNCGIQSTGLRILGEIMSTAPDQYILMMRERNDRSRPSGRSANGNGRDSGPDTDQSPADSGDYDPHARDEDRADPEV